MFVSFNGNIFYYDFFFSFRFVVWSDITGIGKYSVMSNINTKDSREQIKKHKSNNLGWDAYEIAVDRSRNGNLDKLICRLCGHRCSVDVYRNKQHIVGIREMWNHTYWLDEDMKKYNVELEEGKHKKEER